MDCQFQVMNLLGHPNVTLPVSTDFTPLTTEGIGILQKGNPFSVYVHHHSAEAGRLIEDFLSYDDFTDFVMAALYFCPKVNEMLFIFALSVAIINRDDNSHTHIPPLYEIFPDQFVDERYLQEGNKIIQENDYEYHSIRTRREEFPINLPKFKDIIVDQLFSDGADELEQQLAYFREDIGINSHHWHWHLIYPHSFTPKSKGPIKDRRGELFYYVHQQMVRRYNAERLSNGMPLVEPLDDWNDPIKEGYNPHLFSSITRMEYGVRSAYIALQDIDHYDAGLITKKNITTSLERIKTAMTQGYVIGKDDSEIPLEDENGLDILANLMESNAQSPNTDYYGDLHNSGHIMISLLHDPKGKKKEEYGVMAFSETSARDPAFYRWHQFMDNVFEIYKDTLRQYDEKDFKWDDVHINSVNILSNRHEEPNKLYTYFQKRTIDISRGTDFQLDNRTVQAKIRHLQYEKFKYRFNVTNLKSKEVEATVRIFMAPKFKEKNKPFTNEELRRMFFEMDRFRIKMKPGENAFNRLSEDSSVTISPNQSWDQIKKNPKKFDEFADVDNYCGCGWPDHALIPKGNFDGMEFIMFFMLTNWENDKVPKEPGRKTCRDAVSLCGVLNEKYPDKKPLGFPFDRKYKGSPEDYLKKPNTFTRDIIIYHI